MGAVIHVIYKNRWYRSLGDLDAFRNSNGESNLIQSEQIKLDFANKKAELDRKGGTWLLKLGIFGEILSWLQSPMSVDLKQLKLKYENDRESFSTNINLLKDELKQNRPLFIHPNYIAFMEGEEHVTDIVIITSSQELDEFVLHNIITVK